MADTTVETTRNDSGAPQDGGGETTRRDFIYLAVGAMGVVGAGAVLWPIIDSMNPAADTLALATTDVDLAPIEVGQGITVTWRGKPLFVRRRTEAEIEEARGVDVSALPDPQTDPDRVIEPQWLVVVGVCTHLGCIPLGNRATEERGEYGGYFCPCHGSHYDTSGRIRKGPAPTNLPVPEYEFIEETRIRVG
jgi:ubiquinol-cytochrome c reductase iron-sulfur subunit